MVKKILTLSLLFFITMIPNVYAREIGSFTLAKSGNLTSDYLTLYQGSGNFANWGQGTLIYTFGYTTNSTGSLNLPVLTSAYADSGGKSYVCDFGSVAITSPSTSTNATTGVSYTISCPMNMASNGLTNLGLIFSNQFSSSYVLKYSTSYSVEFITEDTFSSQDIINAIAQNAQYTQSVIISSTNNLSSILTNQLTSVNTSLQNLYTNQNQNTQDIIDNQNQNTQDINDNQNQNTQDIIDNQNQNTQEQIESQKVCKDTLIDKSYIRFDHQYLNSEGVLSSSTSWGVTDYIPIYNNLRVSSPYPSTSSTYSCFYNSNKELISCFSNNSTGDISIPSNSSFVRFTIRPTNNLPQFTLFTCLNGNQVLNDSINDLNDSITSEENPNTNQDIDDMNNMVASDTPISDLITMPLTLINAYINGVNSSCNPVNLGNLYGTDLILPCINLEQRLGSNLWHIIDAFFSIFMCYNIGMLFVSAFDGITSLRDDFEGLYQPRHADTGYVPKHGGGN